MDILKPNTVIPSVRRLRDLDAALAAPSQAVLLTNVHIGNLEALVARVHAGGKVALIHTDLLGGFRPDKDGIKLLRTMFKVDGIFTQNAQVLALANKVGLWSVLRIFLIDSRSLERSLEILHEGKADAIEVLPALLAHRRATDFTRVGVPAIAGGMIEEAEEIRALFDAGYTAVTTSNPCLW